MSKIKTIKSPVTGRKWMDRNIGAKRVATGVDDELAYGDYLTWEEAKAIAKKTKGFRLPTIEELLEEQIEDNQDAFDKLKLPCAGYRSYSSVFVSNQGSWGALWSSSVYGEHSRYLSFHSDDAYKYYSNRAYGFSVRLIKKNKKNKENKMIDEKQGLEILLNAINNKIGIKEATKQFKNKTIKNYGWRLPTIQELIALVNYSEHAPACDIVDTKFSRYWCSSTHVSSPSLAWYVYFHSGSVNYTKKYNSLYVRCVRDIDNGLEWSKSSEIEMTWEEAFEYARTLTDKDVYKGV